MEVDYDDSFFEESKKDTDFGMHNITHYQNANEIRRLPKEPLQVNISSQADKSVTVFKHNKNITADSLDSLCYRFRDTLQSYGTVEEVFDMINSFVQNCENNIQIIQNTHSSDISWIESERSTWRLLFAMLRNRLIPLAEEQDSKTISETKAIENLFQRDVLINECQLVIDWLEENASKNHTPNLLHCQDKSVGWECTLYQLQNASVPYASTRPLVDKMDPDAPLRQNKHIHDLDKEDENKLLNQIFMEIRCGNLQNAMAVCKLYGQIWRASILQGWMLYNDPNYDSATKKNLPVIGNPNRDIWKLCAWKLSQSESSPLWKSIIAVFCGNLSAILPACKSWEDILWAHLKVLVDVYVERELRTVNVKSYVPLPDEYWNYKLTLEEIFLELENSTNVSIRTEATKPERTVQKYIILNEIADLVMFLSELCRKNNDYNLLRFSVHLVICIRLIGFGHNEDEANFVIRSYVKFLMRYKDPEIVAYYISFLPNQEQISLYAEYLENIEEQKLRVKCLQSAESYNLNVKEIIELVVAKTRGKTESKSDKTDTVPELTDEDRKKISALDWIVYYEQQRAEAICQTNALIRQFLIDNKLEAAHLAFAKIPQNSIKIIMEQCGGDEESLLLNSSEITPKDKAAIKEYLCYKAYLTAEEEYADWFRCFHNKKPIKPIQPDDNAPFTEKIAYEHNLSHYETQLQGWKTAMTEQTTLLQHCLYNVLLFPDGGWLQDKFLDDKIRLQELDILRRRYIRKITLLLYDIFNNTRRYTDCIKLADIIVAEDYQLYKVYSKQDLREILKKLCESAICLLNENKDPSGYPDVHQN